jgi:CBS domain-containing protein
MMRVADVMTREVRTVAPETTLKEVGLILAELRVSGLPVVEAGRVVGVVSEADILAKERGEGPARRGLLGLLLDDGASCACACGRWPIPVYGWLCSPMRKSSANAGSSPPSLADVRLNVRPLS